MGFVQTAGVDCPIVTDTDIVFATVGDSPLRLDLYRAAPPNEPCPLLVWIHGGGWRKGTKAVYQPALKLIEHGFAVASIEYRLSSEALFPAQIADCRAALRFLRSQSGRFGLDPNRFGVWGCSAGGHLSALLGTSADMAQWDAVGEYPGESAAVQAVCDWFGPTDLLRMNDTPGNIDHDGPGSPESLLIGCPIQQRPDLAALANPIRYISGALPPFLIMHGVDDRTVIPSQSTLLHEALCSHGVRSELVLVPGAGHGFPVEREPWILSKALEFFIAVLGK